MSETRFNVIDACWINDVLVEAGAEVELTESQAKYLMHNLTPVVEITPVAVEEVAETEADADADVVARRRK